MIVNFLFKVVYSALLWLASVTRLSYEEINIVLYYFLLPALYCALLDRIIKRWIFLPLFIASAAVALVTIPNFSNFSDWLFDRSVDFLNWFTVVGWNYTVASVMICVVFPGLVFAALIHFAFPSFYRRQFPTLARIISRPSRKAA